MGTILVIYHSDTGNTQKLAECIAEGANEVPGMEATLIFAEELDIDEAADADGYAIGSPDYFSYVAGQIKTFFDKIAYNEQFHGKPYVGFGTHGGGASVLECIEKLAKSCRLKQVEPGIMTNEAPDEAEAKKARKLGRKLAEAVKLTIEDDEY